MEIISRVRNGFKMLNLLECTDTDIIIQFYDEMNDFIDTKETLKCHPFSKDVRDQWVSSIQHAILRMAVCVERIINTCGLDNPNSFIETFRYIMVLLQSAYHDLFSEYKNKSVPLSIYAYDYKICGTKKSLQVLIGTLRAFVHKERFTELPLVKVFVEAVDKLSSTISDKPPLLAY